jgi:hypothetical protein
MTDAMDDSTSLSLFAGLKLSIDGLTEEMARTRNAFAYQNEKLQLNQPVDADFSVSAAVPSGGGLIAMDCGGPQNGRVWLLRVIVIGGIKWSTTASGSAQLYGSATSPIDTSGTLTANLAQLKDGSASTLPFPAFYSNRQVEVQFPEHLWVVITSGTASQTYTASGSVEDWLLAARREGNAT